LYDARSALRLLIIPK